MRSGLIFAAGVLTALGLAWSVVQPADAATEQVDVGDLYFCAPSFEFGVCTTTITAGDTVTWDVLETAHTVTECDATYTTCPPTGGFDSGVVFFGQSFSQTFPTVGSFPYRCNLHPNPMRGVVVVNAAPTDTPTPTAVPVGGVVELAAGPSDPADAQQRGGRFTLELAALAVALAAVGVAGVSWHRSRRRSGSRR